MKIALYKVLKVVVVSVLSVCALFMVAGILGTIGAGYPKCVAPGEGVAIEFLYIGSDNTFVAKIGDSTTYRKFKFSGKQQPEIGRFRVFGIGGQERELIPLYETAEVSK